MIEPTHKDHGRRVVYTGNRHWGGHDEYGVIASFNTRYVFVRYHGGIDARATRREDLEWAE
jgi:hypothetical protein